MREHYTHSVYPRYSAGSPALVPDRIAQDVKQWEWECYRRSLSGVYGVELQQRARTLGVSGIVEAHTTHAHHTAFLDEMTGEIGIRKNGQRIVKGHY